MTHQEHENTPTGPEPVDDARLRRWIAECDPRKPIDSADPRYFNLDQVELEGLRIDLRGDDHIEGLVDAIALSEGRSCQLFSGFSGTGKSTELLRLTHQLEASGYAVLLVDALDYHDLNHPLTIEDLMVIVTGSFGEATAELLGEKVAPKPYWQQLTDFLKQDLELGDLKVPLGVTDLKIGIKHEKNFWLEMRKALASAPGKLRQHSHSYIQRCVAAIREAKKPLRGVVFVFDSLERLGTTTTAFRQVMDSAVQVLTEYSEFLKLPDCHTIYTVPPYVQLINPGLKDRYDRTSLVLPSVKVLERDGKTPYRPGIEALTLLLGKRVPLEEVFGSRRDLLERLIMYSGGHVRMLISSVRELLFGARRRGLPPVEEDIERVVQPFREQAGMAIWREAVPLLERIRRKGTLEGLTEAEYPYLARLMENHVVLCYRNGAGWYEVHPLVQATVERLAGQQKAADEAPQG